MKKLVFGVIGILIILSACERHEMTPVPDEHALIVDSTEVINAIAVDANNTKWVGTNTGLYIASSNVLTPVNTATFGKVISLYYDANADLLWIGTENGLYKGTISSSSVSETQIPGIHLSNDTIRCAYSDPDNRKWFGTNFGMTMNEGDTWKNDSFRVNTTGRIFTMKNEILRINSITRWNDDVYFATEGGSMWRGKEFNDTVDAFSGATQWISPYNGRNMTSILNVVFVDSKNQLWMGGRNGIQVFVGDDPADITNYTYYDYNIDLPDSIIQVINEASDGAIWVGTGNGLSIYDGSLWTTITDELPNTSVTAIAFDKTEGYAWIGTKKGLLKLKM